jgi:putative addiction module component (TIGR02574 family)
MEQSLIPPNIKKLSIAERILMVEEIWDSIADDQASVEVTSAQKDELDRRLDAYSDSPDEGRSWKEVQQRLKDTK